MWISWTGLKDTWTNWAAFPLYPISLFLFSIQLQVAKQLYSLYTPISKFKQSITIILFFFPMRSMNTEWRFKNLTWVVIINLLLGTITHSRFVNWILDQRGRRNIFIFKKVPPYLLLSNYFRNNYCEKTEVWREVSICMGGNPINDHPFQEWRKN